MNFLKKGLIGFCVLFVLAACQPPEESDHFIGSWKIVPVDLVQKAKDHVLCDDANSYNCKHLVSTAETKQATDSERSLKIEKDDDGDYSISINSKSPIRYKLTEDGKGIFNQARLGEAFTLQDDKSLRSDLKRSYTKIN